MQQQGNDAQEPQNASPLLPFFFAAAVHKFTHTRKLLCRGRMAASADQLSTTHVRGPAALYRTCEWTGSFNPWCNIFLACQNLTRQHAVASPVGMPVPHQSASLKCSSAAGAMMQLASGTCTSGITPATAMRPSSGQCGHLAVSAAILLSAPPSLSAAPNTAPFSPRECGSTLFTQLRALRSVQHPGQYSTHVSTAPRSEQHPGQYSTQVSTAPRSAQHPG